MVAIVLTTIHIIIEDERVVWVIQKIPSLNFKIPGKSPKFSRWSMYMKVVIGKGNKTIICIQESAAMCKHAWETHSPLPQ